jgi:hypothetical protein
MALSQASQVGPGTDGDNLSAQAESYLPSFFTTTPAVGSGPDEDNSKFVVVGLVGLAALTIIVGVINVSVKVRGKNVVDVG